MRCLNVSEHWVQTARILRFIDNLGACHVIDHAIAQTKHLQVVSHHFNGQCRWAGVYVNVGTTAQEITIRRELVNLVVHNVIVARRPYVTDDEQLVDTRRTVVAKPLDITSFAWFC